ncbi:MAG: hypothetical protein JW827_00240 [Spirochaetes bacterium]|nr:hypothetical protein [Spirochaetota bacterium]
MKSQNNLNQILHLLKKNRKNISCPVPSFWAWPGIDFSGKVKQANLFDLLIALIKNILQNDHKQNPKDPRPLVIYGSLIRTTCAYDFDGDGKLSLNRNNLRESGTFLRMILLLPFLKRMGINMIYLLPVTRSSRQYQKGEAPSPYSVKNHLKLDEAFHDPMVGLFSEKKLDLQFKSLIEAAHRMGIKIIIDFIPRTAARDHDLILQRPGWFYWIKKDSEDKFYPPFIKGVPCTPFSRQYNKSIYASLITQEFLSHFTFSPDLIDRKKWQWLVAKVKREKIPDFLDMISETFHVTTAPGFSDVINDPQPLWKDITFLRLHFDHPVDAVPFLKKDQPPYILYDVLKSSRSRFNRPNEKLWNYLCDILPFYQKKYRIDGARIDMGHALPPELEKHILHRPVKRDPGFFLMSEELDMGNSARARRMGYHMIVGNLWAQQARWKNGNIKTSYKNDLMNLSLPVLGSAETHDTPRCITRSKDPRFYYFVTVLNFFLPNTVPFINTGFEIKEKQPMNMGLDTDFCDLHLLPKKDPNYGKLALFDHTFLHWENSSTLFMSLVSKCLWIRKSFPVLSRFQAFRDVKLSPENQYTFSFLYPFKNGFVYIIINSHLKKDFTVSFKIPGRDWCFHSLLDTEAFFEKKEFCDDNIHSRIKRKNRTYQIRLKKAQIHILHLIPFNR